MIDAETDAETAAAWAKHEPQRTFIECADRLQDSGHSVDSLSEAMLTLALHISNRLYGPRAVQVRLMALAAKFANEADTLEREARDEASH